MLTHHHHDHQHHDQLRSPSPWSPSSSPLFIENKSRIPLTGHPPPSRKLHKGFLLALTIMITILIMMIMVAMMTRITLIIITILWCANAQSFPQYYLLGCHPTLCRCFIAAFSNEFPQQLLSKAIKFQFLQKREAFKLNSFLVVKFRFHPTKYIFSPKLNANGDGDI